MRHRRALPLVFAALTIALAGCSTGVPVDGPEPIRSHPSTVASPSPAPTKPALEGLVLRPDGIGDLVVGRPVPVSDPTGALVSWNPTACSEVGLKPGEPYAGLWQTTYPQDPSGPLQPDPFRIGVSGGLQDGDITGVEVYSPQILTERGIHLLSTVADVEAAYPGASKKVFPQSEVYSIAAGPARLDIEVLPPDGSDQGGRVIIMTASASDQDVAALYASDAGYGNCPV